LDRKLLKPEDYQRFLGSLVKLTTRDPLNGNRHIEGRLKALQDRCITLELVGKGTSKKHEPARRAQKPRLTQSPLETDGAEAAVVEIDLGNVEKANLVPEF
jgi:ribosome maturation factor RimP